MPEVRYPRSDEGLNSLEARKKSWDDFQNDPAWKSVKETSEKDGKLVDKVDSVFLSPTDYSAIK